MYGLQGQTRISRDCGMWSLAVCFRRRIASIVNGGSPHRGICSVIHETIALHSGGELHRAVGIRDCGRSNSRHAAKHLAQNLLRIELKHNVAKDGTITTVWTLLCVRQRPRARAVIRSPTLASSNNSSKRRNKRTTSRTDE